MNDNTMPILHVTIDESLARRLPNELFELFRSLGYISQAIEAPAGSAPTGTDAAGAVETGSDSGGNQRKVGHE